MFNSGMVKKIMQPGGGLAGWEAEWNELVQGESEAPVLGGKLHDDLISISGLSVKTSKKTTDKIEKEQVEALKKHWGDDYDEILKICEIRLQNIVKLFKVKSTSFDDTRKPDEDIFAFTERLARTMTYSEYSSLKKTINTRHKKAYAYAILSINKDKIDEETKRKLKLFAVVAGQQFNPDGTLFFGNASTINKNFQKNDMIDVNTGENISFDLTSGSTGAAAAGAAAATAGAAAPTAGAAAATAGAAAPTAGAADPTAGAAAGGAGAAAAAAGAGGPEAADASGAEPPPPLPAPVLPAAVPDLSTLQSMNSVSITRNKIDVKKMFTNVPEASVMPVDAPQVYDEDEWLTTPVDTSTLAVMDFPVAGEHREGYNYVYNVLCAWYNNDLPDMETYLLNFMKFCAENGKQFDQTCGENVRGSKYDDFMQHYGEHEKNLNLYITNTLELKKNWDEVDQSYKSYLEFLQWQCEVIDNSSPFVKHIQSLIAFFDKELLFKIELSEKILDILTKLFKTYFEKILLAHAIYRRYEGKPPFTIGKQSKTDQPGFTHTKEISEFQKVVDKWKKREEEQSKFPEALEAYQTFYEEQKSKDYTASSANVSNLDKLLYFSKFFGSTDADWEQKLRQRTQTIQAFFSFMDQMCTTTPKLIEKIRGYSENYVKFQPQWQMFNVTLQDIDTILKADAGTHKYTYYGLYEILHKISNEKLPDDLNVEGASESDLDSKLDEYLEFEMKCTVDFVTFHGFSTGLPYVIKHIKMLEDGAKHTFLQCKGAELSQFSSFMMAVFEVIKTSDNCKIINTADWKHIFGKHFETFAKEAQNVSRKYTDHGSNLLKILTEYNNGFFVGFPINELADGLYSGYFDDIKDMDSHTFHADFLNLYFKRTKYSNIAALKTAIAQKHQAHLSSELPLFLKNASEERLQNMKEVLKQMSKYFRTEALDFAIKDKDITNFATLEIKVKELSAVLGKLPKTLPLEVLKTYEMYLACLGKLHEKVKVFKAGSILSFSIENTNFFVEVFYDIVNFLIETFPSASNLDLVTESVFEFLFLEGKENIWGTHQFLSDFYSDDKIRFFDLFLLSMYSSLYSASQISEDDDNPAKTLILQQFYSDELNNHLAYYTFQDILDIITKNQQLSPSILEADVIKEFKNIITTNKNTNEILKEAFEKIWQLGNKNYNAVSLRKIANKVGTLLNNVVHFDASAYKMKEHFINYFFSHIPWKLISKEKKIKKKFMEYIRQCKVYFFQTLFEKFPGGFTGTKENFEQAAYEAHFVDLFYLCFFFIGRNLPTYSFASVATPRTPPLSGLQGLTAEFLFATCTIEMKKNSQSVFENDPDPEVLKYVGSDSENYTCFKNFLYAFNQAYADVKEKNEKDEYTVLYNDIQTKLTQGGWEGDARFLSASLKKWLPKIQYMEKKSLFVDDTDNLLLQISSFWQSSTPLLSDISQLYEKFRLMFFDGQSNEQIGQKAAKMQNQINCITKHFQDTDSVEVLKQTLYFSQILPSASKKGWLYITEDVMNSVRELCRNLGINKYISYGLVKDSQVYFELYEIIENVHAALNPDTTSLTEKFLNLLDKLLGTPIHLYSIYVVYVQVFSEHAQNPTGTDLQALLNDRLQNVCSNHFIPSLERGGFLKNDLATMPGLFKKDVNIFKLLEKFAAASDTLEFFGTGCTIKDLDFTDADNFPEYVDTSSNKHDTLKKINQRKGVMKKLGKYFPEQLQKLAKFTNSMSAISSWFLLTHSIDCQVLFDEFNLGLQALKEFVQTMESKSFAEKLTCYLIIAHEVRYDPFKSDDTNQVENAKPSPLQYLLHLLKSAKAIENFGSRLEEDHSPGVTYICSVHNCNTIIEFMEEHMTSKYGVNVSVTQFKQELNSNFAAYFKEYREVEALLKDQETLFTAVSTKKIDFQNSEVYIEFIYELEKHSLANHLAEAKFVQFGTQLSNFLTTVNSLSQSVQDKGKLTSEQLNSQSSIIDGALYFQFCSRLFFFESFSSDYLRLCTDCYDTLLDRTINSSILYYIDYTTGDGRPFQKERILKLCSYLPKQSFGDFFLMMISIVIPNSLKPGNDIEDFLKNVAETLAVCKPLTDKSITQVEMNKSRVFPKEVYAIMMMRCIDFFREKYNDSSRIPTMDEMENQIKSLNPDIFSTPYKTLWANLSAEKNTRTNAFVISIDVEENTAALLAMVQIATECRTVLTSIPSSQIVTELQKVSGTFQALFEKINNEQIQIPDTSPQIKLLKSRLSACSTLNGLFADIVSICESKIQYFDEEWKKIKRQEAAQPVKAVAKSPKASDGTELEALRSKLRELQSQLDEAKTGYDKQLKDATEKFQKEKEALKKNAADKEKEIKQVEEKLSHSQSDLDHEKGKLKTKTEQYDALLKEKNDLARDKIRIEGEKRKSDEDLAAMTTEKDKNKTELTQAKADLQLARDALGLKDTEINALKGRIASLEVQVKALRPAAAPAPAGGSTVPVTTDVTITKTKWDEMIKQIEELTNEKGILESAKTKLTDDETKLKAEIKKLNEVNTKVSGELNTAKTQISDLERDKSTLSHDKGNVETERDRLKTEVSNQKTQIDALTKERDKAVSGAGGGAIPAAERKKLEDHIANLEKWGETMQAICIKQYPTYQKCVEYFGDNWKLSLPSEEQTLQGKPTA